MQRFSCATAASVGGAMRSFRWVGPPQRCMSHVAAVRLGVPWTKPEHHDRRGLSVTKGFVPLLGLGVVAVPRAMSSTAGSSGGIPELVQAIPEDVLIKESRVRLYQFESCPFCRKVRSCLDFMRIPYEIVEVHPLNKDELKEISSDYKKVPILQVSTDAGRNVQMRDSKAIVAALLGDSNPSLAPSVKPPSATQSTGKMWQAGDSSESVLEQWIRWTDVVLVQCIVLNVYRTMSESAETFTYLLTHPTFPWFAQRSAAFSGTVVMWAVAKSRKRKFGVADERLALYESVDAFAEAVKSGGGRFLGGERPGTADFNVFGILKSAEGCQTERDFLEKCSSILPWYNSMVEVVGPSCAKNADSVTRGGA
eukprot:TRINITY_DN3659_c0_g1_i1.p1 TRINITY_DN3659_c0_g1~~TRINITY_DN3659_c0_g1_i1.p1  ORF type:complete len:366 (-),score=45.92 TRINITY_DN3659_c0_g1_i1:204-1301(-)